LNMQSGTILPHEHSDKRVHQNNNRLSITCFSNPWHIADSVSDTNVETGTARLVFLS